MKTLDDLSRDDLLMLLKRHEEAIVQAWKKMRRDYHDDAASILWDEVADTVGAICDDHIEIDLEMY